jgi:hypothetical protein
MNEDRLPDPGLPQDDESQEPTDRRDAESGSTPPVEADDRFPSGPWEGFFLQPMLSRKKGWMELDLTFRNGGISGTGRDWVGTFTVRGRYELDSGKCWWTKRYQGKHDVAYNGYNEGKGIWGLWELTSPPWRGGFHIWPVGMGDPTQLRLREEADLPTDVEAPAEPVPVGAGAGEASESTW